MSDFRIDIEQMSDAFTKYHLRGDMPFNAVLHKFSDVDRGPPHSHPWKFRSVILHGSYVEEIYHPKKGLVRTFERKQGFVTSENRFVDRILARSIAVLADQSSTRDQHFAELYSEDLW